MSHHPKPTDQSHAPNHGASGTDKQTYGYVKCKVTGNIRLKSTQLKSEVQYHLHADLQVAGYPKSWDTAINVGTSDSDDLLNYRFAVDFHHSVIETLQASEAGFHNLTTTGKLPALDFLRSDILAETGSWRPSDVMDGSLDAKPVSILNRLLEKAVANKSYVYIFGRTYTVNGDGIHDVHMNQGSTSPHLHKDNDGNDVWQDGAVLFDFGDPQWVGYFTAFMQQNVPTDKVGDPLPGSHPLTNADDGSLVNK